MGFKPQRWRFCSLLCLEGWACSRAATAQAVRAADAASQQQLGWHEPAFLNASDASRGQCLFSLEPLDEGEGFFQLREAGFFGFEGGGVDAAAETAPPDRVLEVKHLVVEKIFEGVKGAGRTVEDAADDDGVVGGVVMAERALGRVLAPGELGTAEKSAEEARVERVEDSFKIVIAALGAEVALVSAGAANQLGLAGDGGRGSEALVTQVVGGVDGPLVELGQENVGDGADHRLGRAFQQVREVDANLPFAQADGGVQRGKAAETDRDGGHGRPGAQGPVLLLKDWDKISGHCVQLTVDSG